jgi:hypothetical protein
VRADSSDHEHTTVVVRTSPQEAQLRLMGADRVPNYGHIADRIGPIAVVSSSDRVSSASGEPRDFMPTGPIARGAVVDDPAPADLVPEAVERATVESRAARERSLS